MSLDRLISGAQEICWVLTIKFFFKDRKICKYTQNIIADTWALLFLNKIKLLMKADVLTLSSENNNKHSNGVGDIDTIQFV